MNRRGVIARAVAWFIVLVAATSQSVKAEGGALAEPRPEPAVESILRAFDGHALVGLGELHGNEDVHDVLLSLVRDDRFAEQVRDVVVEFGNARSQDVVDRYVAGGDVSVEQLHPAWRDTVNPLTWDSPVYERFYRAVREVNATRPPGKRLRVVLGDVPVEWPTVTKMDDLGRLGSRDVHFAAVVEREVLGKWHKGLLVAGQWHLYKRNPSVEDAHRTPPEELNAAEILLRRHPGQLWVIQPADYGRGGGEVEARCAAWPRGTVAPVAGTWLGALDFGRVTPFPDKLRYAADGKRVDLPEDAPFRWPRVDEVLDAYLWLGPRRDLRWRKVDPATYDDAAYLNELRRRGRLMGYPPAHFKFMTGHDLSE